MNTVLSALDLGEGDEVLTSDEEHPGLLAPLGLARERSGVRIRVAPFASLASAVSDETRLIACSHVSWISGEVVDAAALAASEAPVLLDGAQGLGAVPVDVEQLGCDFYAACGQKWPCGPNGIGYLYVRRVGDLLPPGAGFGSLSDPDRPLDLELHQDARRFDAALPASHQLAWAHAALDVLEAAGFAEVHAHAAQTARAARARAGGTRPGGRPARELHARLLGAAGSRGDGRAAAARGRRGAPPAANALRPRLGRRLDRRRRPRAPAQRPLGGLARSAARSPIARAPQLHLSVMATIPKITAAPTSASASTETAPKIVASAPRPERLESTARVAPKIAIA